MTTILLNPHLHPASPAGSAHLVKPLVRARKPTGIAGARGHGLRSPGRAACVGLAGFVGFLAWTACLQIEAADLSGTLRLLVRENGGDPVPCRVHLRGPDGRSILPPPGQFPSWRDHFVCTGRVDLALAPGDYSYEIERGPEYPSISGRCRVEADSVAGITHDLRRLVDVSTEGWWSGDLHVHRPLSDIELLMRAEDLHIAPVITWWNGRGPWASNPPPPQIVVPFDDHRFYAPLAGEDERGGGALLYFGLKQPLPLNRTDGREYPPSTRYLREAKAQPGSWVDIEKPFWWDVPIWLASGLPDSVGIAHNHMHRGGVYPGEAWGRPRNDREYAGIQGNGRYTQALYYHLLNCGFRIPPSAGSASGVLPNPVGYNRAYVHVEGELTWDKWWDGLRAGHVFVGNGPLLRARANGQLPGETFRNDGPLRVRFDTRMDSREPVAAVELVHNGRIQRLPYPPEYTVYDSGWILLRAIADVTNTFRFASTAPWYFEIGGAPPHPVRRESAQLFLDWTRERRAAVEAAISSATERSEALAPILEADRFWTGKLAEAVKTTPVRGAVVDEASGANLPSRVYLRRSDGRWSFPISASPEGSAFSYERQNWINARAVEYHTTLSAHPFQIELEPGRYEVTAERGKEYRPLTREFVVGAEPVELRLPLQRWIDMSARGWFSGDTHVHRTLQELPNVMLAEDVNVAFPLTYWVTRGFAPPTEGDKNTDRGAEPGLVKVDDTHVFWPRNTEYEIFSVDGRSHTLGALFVLGHATPLSMGVPPVGPVAEHARREGALLDLDKHDWPWSLALVPLLGVDLFELANNHHWRTEFGITNWSSPTSVPAWLQPPSGGRNGDELAWTHYTLGTWYALLDCGFSLRPTAGTANGVHPVPLGFGRVYVHLPRGFTYDAWREGLNAGRSFVTTGPMLLAELNGEKPGAHIELQGSPTPRLSLSAEIVSEQPVETLEIVVNGDVIERLRLSPERQSNGAHLARVEATVPVTDSGWVALRCWEPRPTGRFRFAHTATWKVTVPDRPLRPRQREVDFLVERVRDEMTRSRDVLPAAAIQEYQQALDTFQKVGRNTRP